MRVITRRATMLAGDRSQGVVEAQLRQSRNEAEARSVLRVFQASLVITRIVRIGTYFILCDFGAYMSFYAYTRIQSGKVEIAVIIAHLTSHFANTSGHFDFLDLVQQQGIVKDACAVQMYKALSARCQSCTNKKKNKKKITLRCIVIGAYAVQFLHCIPVYRNIQHYATLNCSTKTSLRSGGT